MKNVSPSYLKHQFLIAMPHMADPNFAHTLTYIVEHTANGAMGLVVNRPQDLNLADILEQLRPISNRRSSASMCRSSSAGRCRPIAALSCIRSGRAFRRPLIWKASSALSTSQDVLFAIADGVARRKA